MEVKPNLTVGERVVVDVERIVDEDLVERFDQRLLPLLAAQVLEHLVEHSSHLLWNADSQADHGSSTKLTERTTTSSYHHELVDAPLVNAVPFSENGLEVRPNEQGDLVVLVVETADQIADPVGELFLPEAASKLASSSQHGHFPPALFLPVSKLCRTSTCSSASPSTV